MRFSERLLEHTHEFFRVFDRNTDLRGRYARITSALE
jgi:hypothetical protein